MIQVRSAIATRRGQRPAKQGLNLITASWDGNTASGQTLVHLDARTLYKYGNNMGINFILEGSAPDGTVSIKGSPKALLNPYSSAETETWVWATITSLAVGGTFFYNDNPEMYQTLRLDFGGTGKLSLFINRG